LLFKLLKNDTNLYTISRTLFIAVYMASIARKNLLEDLPRFLVAQAGIMFAVSLVTIQTGLQSGFNQSSSQLIDQSQADLWVASDQMEHLRLTMPLEYGQVSQAETVEGVAVAEGIIIKGAMWEEADKIAAVTMVGSRPDGLLFAPENLVENSFTDLEQDYSFITDTTNLEALGINAIGDEGEINGLPAQLVGLTTKTQSVVMDNMIFASLESVNTYRQGRRTPEGEAIREPTDLQETDEVTFILVQAEEGTDLEALKARLETELEDIQVYTRQEMSAQNQAYWQERSGIGYILTIGATVGIVVGIVVVGQILYASVSDHLKEFGTLKAMGASDWFLYRAIIEQGLWMAVLGYVPGISLCLGVSAWTATSQGIVILVTPISASAVFAITVVMCVTSAVFAIQKVTRVDPAIVFKG
jgi:putative ABC transport system permease protein